MPISDYANAFFFARRNRVTHDTLLCRNAIVFVFPKSIADRSPPTTPVTRRSLRQSPVIVPLTTRRVENPKIAGRKVAGVKNKKPGMAGLVPNFFRLAYFASFAI